MRKQTTRKRPEAPRPEIHAPPPPPPEYREPDTADPEPESKRGAEWIDFYL